MDEAAERLYEQVLIVRCQAGDPDALSELIARYAPGLRFFLRKMAGDSTADDLLQDVWVDVFAKISRLREPTAFAAWIYQIARYKVYAQRSRQQRTCESIDDEPIDDAEQKSFSAEEAAAVRGALDQIDLQFREVLLLRFLESMSYEQIGRVISKPIGTVRSRLHYAKRALRAVIENNLKDGEP